MTVAAGALRIGNSLLRTAKVFSKSVGSAVGDTTIRAAQKIKRSNVQINYNNKVQEGIRNRIAQDRERMNKGGGGNVNFSPIKRNVNKIIEKPLEALMKMLAAWSIQNLPGIIKNVETFVKRVRIFSAAINNTIKQVGPVFRSMVAIGTAFIQNMREFDFSDSSGRIKTAQQQLDVELETINTNFNEIKNVWGREEKELDRILTELTNGAKLDEAIETASRETMTPIIPQNTAVGGGSRTTTGAGMSRNLQALLKTISYAEGTSGPNGYNTWFGGRTDMDLSKMTINEVVAEQKRRLRTGEATYGGYTSAAVGKYQMMLPEDAARAAGLDPNTAKFTPENQDKMVVAKYLKGQAKLTDAQLNGPITPEVIDKLAPVFASFPNLFGPDAKGRVGTNTSYYGQGGKSEKQITEYYGKSLKSTPETKEQAPPQQPVAAPPSGSGTVAAKGSTTKTPALKKGDSVSGFSVTSAYGPRWGSTHRGVDLATPVGTYVAFVAPCEIIATGTYGNYGYLIDVWVPSLGVQYRLAHLSKIMVKKGQKIPAGVPVGRTGGAAGHPGSGRSTGPHLHYEVDTKKGSTNYGGSNNTSDLAKYAQYIILSTNPPSTSSSNVSMNGKSREIASARTGTIGSRRTGAGTTKTRTVIMKQNNYVMVG